MKNQEVLAHARLLSSGTIANLIDDNRYVIIDKARDDFILFIIESKKKYESWVDAWLDFRLNTKYVGISTLVEVR